MKLSSAALSMVTLAPPLFGGMVTGKPKTTYLYYKIKKRFDSIQHSLRNLEEESNDCCCCCCDTNNTSTNDDTNNGGDNSSSNSPSTSTPTTPMPSGEPTTRSDGLNSAMFNIYTALGTTTIDLTGTTYCTWTGVNCDSDNIEPTYIELGSESLTGYLATDIGMITDLERLELDGNELTGSIPTELSKNVNLLYLDLGGNQFTGAIPDLSGLSALTRLLLDYNQLTGTINTSVLPTTALGRLDLGGNQFTGFFPDLSGFSATTQFFLGDNQIAGTINPSLLPSNVQYFYFDSNLGTGTIPDFSGLTALRSLYISDNDLTSSIPDVSSYSASIDTLHLGKNDLTGALPDLSSLSLEELYIRETLIDASTLPDWLFDIGYYINVIGNAFTGAIPASMGGTSAEIVFLSENQLTGAIPDEISGMTNTHSFAVADNDLSGPIPAGVDQMSMNHWMGFYFDVRNNPSMNGFAPSTLCSEDYFYYVGTGIGCQ